MLVEAIATHKRYKQNKQGEWTNFYTDICKSELFRSNPGFTGNCFEALVSTTIGKLEKDRPIFEDASIGRETRDGSLGGLRKGDHHRLIAQGKNIVVECKAVTSTTPTPENLEQAKDYYKIVKNGIIGYIAKEVNNDGDEELIKPNKYSHVTYVFPVQPIAAGWYHPLLLAFNEEDKLFSTVPSHDGTSVSVLLKANPEFMIHLDGKGPSYAIKNPPIFHPGMKVRDLDITLAQPGPRIAKGSMHADVDLAGAVKAENQKLDITPGAAGAAKPQKPSAGAPTGDAAVSGTITNELGKGATSKLDKLLGKIKPSVVLTDTGVKGTLTLEKGGKIAPGLAIDRGEIVAIYDNGKLTASGGVHIVHQHGKFDVDLKVGWDGHEWTFHAVTTVHEGLIDGLSEFSLTVDYQSGAWRIGSPEASYHRKIGGVDLTGKVKDLVIDPHHGEVAADVFLTADLGAFGKAGADARIERGKLKSATFSYDTPELVFPKKNSGKPPVFTGAIGGTLRYDEGHLSGKIHGEAHLALPGLKALADKGEIGLAVDAQVDKDGKFSGSIESKTALTFGKHFRIPHLLAKINPEGDVEAHFELQLSGLKNVSDARLAAAIDKNGFHIEGGGVTIALGDKDKDRMWGAVTAYYHEGEGLVIGGLVNVKIKDGMIGTGWLNYSTQKGTGDAGVTVSRIPILDVNGETKKLVDFDRQIPVFSFFGITLFIDARFTLEFLYGFKLGLSPTVQVKGIDLHDLSFQEAIATIEVDGDLGLARRRAGARAVPPRPAERQRRPQLPGHRRRTPQPAHDAAGELRQGRRPARRRQPRPVAELRHRRGGDRGRPRQRADGRVEAGVEQAAHLVPDHGAARAVQLDARPRRADQEARAGAPRRRRPGTAGGRAQGQQGDQVDAEVGLAAQADRAAGQHRQGQRHHRRVAVPAATPEGPRVPDPRLDHPRGDRAVGEVQALDRGDQECHQAGSGRDQEWRGVGRRAGLGGHQVGRRQGRLGRRQDRRRCRGSVGRRGRRGRLCRRQARRPRRRDRRSVLGRHDG